MLCIRRLLLSVRTECTLHCAACNDLEHFIGMPSPTAAWTEPCDKVSSFTKTSQAMLVSTLILARETRTPSLRVDAQTRDVARMEAHSSELSSQNSCPAPRHSHRHPPPPRHAGVTSPPLPTYRTRSCPVQRSDGVGVRAPGGATGLWLGLAGRSKGCVRRCVRRAGIGMEA